MTSPTGSMVERVAGNIGKEVFLSGGPELSEHLAQVAARAALEAMRERNEAMLDAGTAVLWPHVQQLAPGSTAVAVYEAMIDAALQDTLPSAPEEVGF